MTMHRVYNFAAGPSQLPLPVLERAQKELLDYEGTGMSVMEMSHRSAAFSKIMDHTKLGVRDVLHVPDDYAILFLAGGASSQFTMIPLNLLKENHQADYAITGHFAKLAYEEGNRYGQMHVSYDGSADACRHIPRQDELTIHPDASYFHYCANNTIYGTEWHYVPDTHGVPIVADMSSDIASCPMDVSKFGLIYAGAQKNLAPAGVTLVIVRKDLVKEPDKMTPVMYSYMRETAHDSMYNTPPCWQIYMLGLVTDWLKDQGGMAEIGRRNKAKADLLYGTLEQYPLFHLYAEKESRSRMNVTFSTGDPDLDARFIQGAADHDLVNVKGHRLLGGMRASIYNAMDLDGVKALCRWIEQFASENRKG
ncbi:MAG: 3-phosphoserine/phosphohydroxythreonine transaminase [Lactimicrobium sp.]|uniref:3-phosphoserine/phosphohydroxythreonine transaminase n=1 Tax=Lactimicrobium sp. TaxID=2563780 RepID=UPI002F358539